MVAYALFVELLDEITDVLIEGCTRSSTKAAPVEEVAPAVEEVVPAVEEVIETPAVEEVIEEVTPEVEEVEETPAVEEVAPAESVE